MTSSPGPFAEHFPTLKDNGYRGGAGGSRCGGVPPPQQTPTPSFYVNQPWPPECSVDSATPDHMWSDAEDRGQTVGKRSSVGREARPPVVYNKAGAGKKAPPWTTNLVATPFVQQRPPPQNSTAVRHSGGPSIVFFFFSHGFHSSEQDGLGRNWEGCHQGTNSCVFEPHSQASAPIQHQFGAHRKETENPIPPSVWGGVSEGVAKKKQGKSRRRAISA